LDWIDTAGSRQVLANIPQGNLDPESIEQILSAQYRAAAARRQAPATTLPRYFRQPRE
jgi:hypothetical protein